MFIILGFYKFKNLKSLKRHKIILEKLLSENDIRGTLIISKEGLNGTLSGASKNISKISKIIKNSFKIKKFDSENLTKSKLQPFHKPKIKIKTEVVPIGIKLSKINKKKTYIEPNKWNSLLRKSNIKIIDARKPFEFNMGTFKGAENPNIDNFRDFPNYLKKLVKKNQ